MGVGGVVLAQPGGIPARLGERAALPYRAVEGAVQARGAGGVVQGLLMLPMPPPGLRELIAGVGLVSEIVVTFGRDEGLLQALDRLLVMAQIGVADAQKPVGIGVGRWAGGRRCAWYAGRNPGPAVPPPPARLR